MTYDETVIAIFCKAPIPGRVKTRLAADIGTAAATAIYRACAEHTVWSVRHAGLPTVVFMDRREAAPAFHDWLGGMLAVQEGDDLGARMENAVRELLDHGYKRVIIVGTDAPFVSEKVVHDAAVELMTHDVVIGPALDGGYYLIGTSEDRPQLFEGVEWSTDKVLQTTLDICENNDWSVAQLEPHRDIDTKADLDAILAEAPKGHDDFMRRCHLILHHEITG